MTDEATKLLRELRDAVELHLRPDQAFDTMKLLGPTMRNASAFLARAPAEAPPREPTLRCAKCGELMCRACLTAAIAEGKPSE